MDWPLMVTFASSELPLTAGPDPVHIAIARAMRKLAETVLPATLRLTFASEASERTRSPWATVAACRVSTVSKVPDPVGFATLTDGPLASRENFLPLGKPVLEELGCTPRARPSG